MADVATKNDVWVCQTADAQYAIHQYKDFVGVLTAVNLEWEGKTDHPPVFSTVYLQIYNRNTPAWETVDSDNASPANADFTLSGNIPDLTNYKDGSDVISCRIWQLAV